MSEQLIKARDLHKYYSIKSGYLQPSKNLKALAGAGFDLYAGKTLAVVGESGCGKSTLARLLTMIEKPTSGQLSIDGIDVAITTDKSIKKQLRQSIQMVFQDPFGSLNPRQKIGNIIQEPLTINTNLSTNERHQKVLEMMELVGLRKEHFQRYPHMFSGGQRQRVAIARALILKPKVVVLDEPVSALDVSIQAQVINLLIELQQELGLAYVFISHDLSVVEHICDRLAVMYLGRIVETGPVEDFFKTPFHPYSRALIDAVPVTDPSIALHRTILEGDVPSPINPPSGCHFHPRCVFRQDRCKETTPPLRDLSPNRQVACHFPLA